MGRLVRMLMLVAAVLAAAPGARAETAPRRNLRAEQAGERLGLELFFFKGWSKSGLVSCNSCHTADIRFGYSDGRRVAVGDYGNPLAPNGLLGLVNTPTLLFSAYPENRPVTTNGRVRGVYEWCTVAIQDARVMGMPSVDAAVREVARHERFQRLSRLAYNQPVNESTVRTALCAFLKTLRYDDLPADRLYRGEHVALPSSALRGWELFKANCIDCHRGDNYWRDDDFHDIGLRDMYGEDNPGRFSVTRNRDDLGKHATRTLAGVPLTQPYWHNGRERSLRGVVYYKGSGGAFVDPAEPGVKKRSKHIDPLIARIRLDQRQCEDLLTFLELGFQGGIFPEVKNPFGKDGG